MKIALAQLNYTVGDVAGNTNKIIESVRRAKAEGADLVVFAEQATAVLLRSICCGKILFLEQCEDALMRIAAECDTVDAIVGLPILTKEGTISAAALIQQGRVVRYVGKQNITVRRELGFLTPSKGCEYVTIRGCRCALVVGDDLFHTPDFDKSVETVINIHARRYRKGDLSRRYDVIPEYRLRQGKECGDGQSGRRCYGAGLRRDVGRDGQPGQAGAVAEKFRRGLSGVRYRKIPLAASSPSLCR